MGPVIHKSYTDYPLVPNALKKHLPQGLDIVYFNTEPQSIRLYENRWKTPPGDDFTKLPVGTLVRNRMKGLRLITEIRSKYRYAEQNQPVGCAYLDDLSTPFPPSAHQTQLHFFADGSYGLVMTGMCDLVEYYDTINGEGSSIHYYTPPDGDWTRVPLGSTVYSIDGEFIGTLTSVNAVSTHINHKQPIEVKGEAKSDYGIPERKTYYYFEDGSFMGAPCTLDLSHYQPPDGSREEEVRLPSLLDEPYFVSGCLVFEGGSGSILKVTAVNEEFETEGIHQTDERVHRTIVANVIWDGSGPLISEREYEENGACRRAIKEGDNDISAYLPVHATEWILWDPLKGRRC